MKTQAVNHGTISGHSVQLASAATRPTRVRLMPDENCLEKTFNFSVLMRQSAIVISILTVALLITAATTEQPVDTNCPATPKLEIVSAIAPAAGAYPVWVVDGSFGRWRSSGTAVKTAWILARDHPGDLTVVGRRIDGDGRALFALQDGAELTDQLVIANADNREMIPGGIDPDELRKYSFRSSGVVYPSAGCWELLVRYGESESRIVLELIDQP